MPFLWSANFSNLENGNILNQGQIGMIFLSGLKASALTASNNNRKDSPVIPTPVSCRESKPCGSWSPQKLVNHRGKSRANYQPQSKRADYSGLIRSEGKRTSPEAFAQARYFSPQVVLHCGGASHASHGPAVGEPRRDGAGRCE